MLNHLRPRIRRLVAPNPSPLTGPGTNGYIVGTGRVSVVDPGPDDDQHLAAWLDALAGEEVTHVLVTHAHRDHSALARRLADAVGAPILGFGPWDEGRSDTMKRLAYQDGLVGGEGVDESFAPDRRVGAGDIVSGPDWRLEVLHVPGHFAGHLAFASGDVVFTGDHVLAWTSTLISPPDGDMRQFLASCAQLKRRGEQTFLPGHGDPIVDPSTRLDWLVAHRRKREAQIVAAVADGTDKIDDLVRRLYADTPPALHAAASRNVLAHLVMLVEDGEVTATPGIGLAARYHPAQEDPEMAGRLTAPLL